jgi:hypothetical protein
LPALTGARTEPAAVERHRERIQLSLTTVSASATWYPFRKEHGSWGLATTPPAIELTTEKGARLYLVSAQSFMVVQPRTLGGYKVRTTGYTYSVGLTDAVADARLAWHWHPDLGRKQAHIHVFFRDEVMGKTDKWHLPTSRVFFEQVLHFLIGDLGVSPTRSDWVKVLDEVREGVEAAATWRGDAP